MGKLIPIGMNDHMAKAARNCTKTVTRRIATDGNCRYGIGDILYVTETHYVMGSWVKTNQKTKTGRIKYKFCPVEGFNYPIGYSDELPNAILPNFVDGKPNEAVGYYKRLGRFMPKAYARTFLEVQDIKKEPLHDITPQDCIKEGIPLYYDPVWGYHYAPHKYIHYGDGTPVTPLASFQSLWELLHGPDSWAENKEVWRIQFVRIPPPDKTL